MDARRAVIYCRISRDKAGAGLGVERQEEDCRALAERLGWEVSDVYVDNDISASSGKRRPAYQRMLNDLAAGRASAVIAWHSDRLHRRPVELESFIDLCETHHVEIRTVQAGEMDLSTASGRMVARMLGAAARHEVEHKSERIRRARVQAAKAGKYHGGRRCYGYESDGNTLRDSEAGVLRDVADQILAGVSLRQVVADLNRRKVPTTNGTRAWDSATLRGALTAPRITGLSAHHGEIVGEAEWPAIVDRDKWHALQAMFADPKRRSNGAGIAPRWLGSGLYVCGVCGSTDVRVNNTTDGRRRYRCRNRVKGDPKAHIGRDQLLLDEYVVGVLLARLARPDAATLFVSTPTESVDIGALTVESTALAERLDGLAVLFTQGAVTAAQLTAGTEEVRRKQEAIDRKLASAVTSNPLAGLAGVTAADIESRWNGLSLGIQRQILRSIVTVTILPTVPGRKRDGGYFDYDAVQFDWSAR